MAVNTLAKVINDPQTPTAAKITAAMGLLRFGRDGIELDDLAQRVEALVGAVEQQDGRKQESEPMRALNDRGDFIPGVMTWAVAKFQPTRG